MLDADSQKPVKVDVTMHTAIVVQANSTVKADLDFKYARKTAKAVGTLSVSIKRPAPPPSIK
jgi:hypothetical protein